MTRHQQMRVGIVGSCPAGQGLLERLIILPYCEIVLFNPAGSLPSPYSHSPGVLAADDWRSFLFEMDVEAVLFLVGRTLDRPQVLSALDADLFVGVLPPLPLDALNWPPLDDKSSNQIRLLSPHREDADFLGAGAWLRTRPLEPYSAIKRLSWVAGLIETNTPGSNAVDGWFSGWLWDDLDQLLVLTGESPESVFAAEFSEDRECYSLILRFPQAMTAHLERRRSALVPLEIGWTLSSGYANGRQYLRTQAGEIYDVPIENAENSNSSSAGVFDPLAVFDRSHETDSWNHALNVLKVQAAIRESAELGQPVRLN